jgi:hypothetical protein
LPPREVLLGPSPPAEDRFPLAPDPAVARFVAEQVLTHGGYWAITIRELAELIATAMPGHWAGESVTAAAVATRRTRPLLGEYGIAVQERRRDVPRHLAFRLVATPTLDGRTAV